jgi:hypothetical protein
MNSEFSPLCYQPLQLRQLRFAAAAAAMKAPAQLYLAARTTVLHASGFQCSIIQFGAGLWRFTAPVQCCAFSLLQLLEARAANNAVRNDCLKARSLCCFCVKHHQSFQVSFKEIA